MVALLNRSKKEVTISFEPDSLGLDASPGCTMRDVWVKKDFVRSTATKVSMQVPSHGVVVLRMKGVSRPFNVFQYM